MTEFELEEIVPMVVDVKEVDRFDQLADNWWATDGPMAPLHAMNPVRMAYILDRLTEHVGLDRNRRRPLEGLRVLDVGCGCGILCEPMARLGAKVTGLDPSQQTIEVARRHAEQSHLTIDYLAQSTDDYLASRPESFDVVTCLEVVEHSPAGDILIEDLAELTKPGGVLVMSTLNRTTTSFLKAIVGAEYLLGWLPKGTHDWRRFRTPSELSKWLRQGGFAVRDVHGIDYDPVRNSFSLARNRSVNYLVTALRT